jgi:hypothetical protein
MTPKSQSCLAVATLMLAVFSIPSAAQSQATDRELQLLRLLGVPITALPPLSLPMPASRNHNYYIGRLQAGYRKGPSGDAIPAVAGGIDFQYKGGSIIGVTGGWQRRDCGVEGDNCGGHAMFGVRSQINLMTGGSVAAGLLHDNSTTSTLGIETGFGYAPKVAGDLNACAIDVGVPLSVAKRRQRPRVVGYLSPGIVWDFNCGSSGPGSHKTYKTDFGFALQQVGNRSFDIYFGMQKLFRGKTGFQTGLSFTYVRLP